MEISPEHVPALLPRLVPPMRPELPLTTAIRLQPPPAARFELALSALWRDLVQGTARIVHDFFTDTSCGLVTALAVGPARPVAGRQLEIVQRALTQSTQKQVALELGLACATVAGQAKAGLKHFGVQGRASRVHPLLMLAARAAGDPAFDKMCVFEPSVVNGHLGNVVSIQRPERLLSGFVTPAELAVVAGFVEGKSHAEIARGRGTSTRTIANQIACIFRRLRVSGRADLVHFLFEWEARRKLPTSLAQLSSAGASFAR
jgi:DNA-binding CsgD family transcriptional regulator